MPVRFKLSSEIAALLIILLALIPTLSALFPAGFFLTHDGDYHLVRLAHFYRMVTTYGFPVRMIPEAAHLYGYPAFTFFYPFPYMISSIFHGLGFNLGTSLKLFIGLSSAGSIYAMYAWLRCHFRVYPSLVGALLYLFVPFRFVTLYVTGQLGGLTSFLWAPLLLLGLYQLIVKKQLRMIPVIALVSTAFVLSHIISFVAFLPLIGIYILCLLLLQKNTKQQKLRMIGLVGLSFLLGFGVSSFYVIPATAEKHLIRMGTQLLINHEDHWLTLKQMLYSPWGYGYSGVGDNDLISFQIGIAQLGVLGLSALAVLILFLFRKKLTEDSLNQNAWVATSFLALTALMVFLMLSVSAPIWKNVSVLQNIQYPWRLLAVIMCLTAFLAAWIASLHAVIRWSMIAIVVLAMFGTRNYMRNSEPKRYPDSHYLETEFLYPGTLDISGELMPAQAKGMPMYAEKTLVNQPSVEIPNVASMDQTFSLDLAADQIVVLNRFYYPNWQVSENGQVIEIFPSEKGLLSFDAPTGKHEYQLKVIETGLEKVSNGVSLISLIIALLLIYQTNVHPSRRIPLHLVKYSSHTRKSVKS